MFGLMPYRRETREYTPFELLNREFPALFNRVFGGWPMTYEPPWEMAEPWGLTLDEMEEEFVVRVEVPGYEAGELEVNLTGDVLTIRAEHKEKAKGELPAKRRYDRFERTVTLPAGILPEKIEARCINGVLEIHLPRTPEVKPRRIEVKT
jgi:HSP20 family protein